MRDLGSDPSVLADIGNFANSINRNRIVPSNLFVYEVQQELCGSMLYSELKIMFEFVWNCRLLTVILACGPFGCIKYISKLCSLEMQSQELNCSEILKF